MSRTLLIRLSSLVAVVALGACAGSTDAPSAGNGGSAGPGSAGATGTAGTSGAAGDTGTAGVSGTAGNSGSAGNTGSAGNGSAGNGSAGNGSAGSIAGAGGVAGRGGASGVAGATGTAGSAGGRGGSAGTAGASGGRGGAGGTAGASGGRGGTTGTAGVTGGGGAGGCTITATSTLGTIPTVGIVTFTTSLASFDSAEIRFGLASTGPTMTAPVDPAQPSYRTLLLGMKGSSSYVYRIVATSSAGTCTSTDYTIMTGAVPTSVPKPTATIMNAASHAKGFMVTSSGISGTGAWIYDSDGAPVWWATGPSGMNVTGTSRIQMSWDGSKMYMMALNVTNNSGGKVNIVNMDGSGATSPTGMTASHHDMAAIPGGFATLLWNSSGIDAPCSLVERADDGTMKTIIANMSSVYNSTTWHTNSIHYYPSDDTYTLGDRNPNMYVKVSRTGTLIWQFGGSNPKDMTKFFSGAGTWMVNHGHHMLADGSFYLFNNGPMNGNASVVRGFKLNTTNMTATSTFTYMGSNVNSTVMGDVQALPNGNILVTASTTGQITEVTTGGQVVATFKTSAFGYTEYRDSLYGPPPR